MKLGSINVYIFILLLVIILLYPFCKFTSYIPPNGSILLVSVNPSSIFAGEQAVIEVIGYKPNGSLLPDGTILYFSTSIGTINRTVELYNGVAENILKTEKGISGEAQIIVSSGNAVMSPEKVAVTITTNKLNKLIITADPQILAMNGGESEIIVRAFDENMSFMSNIPVVISASAGYLYSKGDILYTDSNGEVNDILYTTTDSTVTAQSGDIQASINISVESNDPPVAAFVFSPESPVVDQDVFFNGVMSTDSDGYIVRYSWSFGDGKSGQGEKVTHKYSDAGTYSVVLTVYDNKGNRNSVSKDITIAEQE